MQTATILKFSEHLSLAHDFNRGGAPADGAERATREEILEYIDAFTVDKSPDHPTTAIAWDLQRTLGESEGRRMLLYASRRWDAKPLRARDVVKMYWDDDIEAYEPQAWVDEYLLDVIRDWRAEIECKLAEEDRRLALASNAAVKTAMGKQRAMRTAAEDEWLAFNGRATQQQLDAWKSKFASLLLPFERTLADVTIIPFPTPATPPAPVPTPALQLTFFDECRERAPKHWILKGVFAKGENSSIFGAPGTLKSAFLVDAAIHAASGKDWRGFKSKERCGVVYFAFERADQVRRRLSAYAVRDGVSDLPISVAGQIVDMLNPGCVDIIVATIRAAEARFGIPVGFIIFDTWSKGIAAGGGDEDKARDQNVIAANLRRIHEHVSVHIAGVGHSGKDESRGERGSNARQGDVDLQIQITGDTTKTATVIKANDQPEGPLTSFAGEVIALDTDEDGEPVTAFILSTRICTAVAPTSKLSDRQVLALDALRRAIKDHGKRAEGMQAVEVDHWREELFRSGVIERDASNPRADFKRLRDGLARSKRIVEQDGLVRMGYAAPVTPPAMLPPLPPGH